MSKTFSRYAQDMAKICPKYAQDIPKICLRHGHGMPKICPIYTQHMPKICSIYAQDMPRICPSMSHDTLNNFFPSGEVCGFRVSYQQGLKRQVSIKIHFVLLNYLSPLSAGLNFLQKVCLNELSNFVYPSGYEKNDLI